MIEIAFIKIESNPLMFFFFEIYLLFSLLGLLILTHQLAFAADEDCNVNTGKNCFQNTYNLINKINYSLIKDTDELKEGNLFYCSGDPVSCNEVTEVGYYVVDASTVYTCKDIGAGLTCTKEAIDETITSCDAASVGKLFMDSTGGSNNINLCLSNLGSPTKKPLSITLSIGSSGIYLLEKNADAAANVFGITGSNDQYAIVKVKDKVVTLHSTYDSGLKYVYVNAVTSKVMERGDKTCPPKTGTTEPDEDNILELSCSKGKCKSSESEIVFDTTAKGINVLKNDAGTITVMDSSGLGSATTDDMAKMGIYNCDGKGHCEKIPGYIIKAASTYYKVDASSAAPALVTVPEKTATDCKDNVGLIINESTNKICLDDGVVGAITTGNSFIFGTSGISADAPFTNAANRMVTITDTYIAIDTEFAAENSKDYFIKNGDNFHVYKYMQATGTFNPDEVTDIMVYQKIGTTNVFKEVDLSNTAAFPDKPSVASWTIFDCIKGKCKQAYGYVKSNDATVRYFVIPQSGSSNNDIIASDNISANCASADSGTKKLMTGGALCVTYHDTDPVSLPMENGNTYIITETADFTGATSAKIVIKATANTLTYSANYDDLGTNLFSGYQKISKRQITAQNKSTLSLYNCPDTGICTLIPGYVLNGNAIYTISATPASDVYTPAEADDCTGKLGEIIQKADGAYYLCLTANLDVAVTHTGNYVFGTLLDSNVFASANSDKLIKVSEDFVVLDTIDGATNDDEYIFKIDDAYKAYKYVSDGTKYTAESTSIIHVYKAVNDHDNVIKFVSSLTSIAAETDLSGHRLFKCTSGDCVESKGYVLGGTDATAKIYSNFGENWAPVTDGACAADGDIGNTYLATSKIQLCMPISGTPTKTDVAASSYLLKKANTSYKKYTGNAATSTIVIMEEPVAGSYVVASTNIIATTGDTTEGNLVSCSGSPLSCSAKSIASLTAADVGYYYNPNDITKIINCVTGTAKCTVAAPTVVGYYKTVNSDYVLWDGTTASLAPTKTCTSDTIGQWDTTANKLCLDGTKTAGFATSSASPTNYMVYYHKNSAFSGSVDGETKYGIVKATDNTISIDDAADTNYCVDANMVATAIGGSSNCDATKTRYNCNNGICTLVAALPVCDLATAGETTCDASLSTITSTLCVKADNSAIFESTPTACADKAADYEDGNYYIFKCTDGKTCSKVTDASTLTASDQLYIYKFTSTTAGDGTTTVSLDQQKDISYFTATKLLHCDSDGRCALVTTATPTDYYYVNVAATGLTDSLYQCTGSGTVTCTAITAEDNKNYLDATDSKNVIHCTTADLCTSAAGSTTAGQAYIDSRETGGKQLNVITCNSDGCTSSTGITTGQVYIDAIQDNSKNPNVITCTAAGCTSGAGSTTDGQAYIDATDKDNGYKKVIKCTGGTCASEAGSTTAGQAYIDAIQSGGQNPNVIICTATGCTSSPGSNTYTDAITNGNTITCEAGNCASTGG